MNINQTITIIKMAKKVFEKSNKLLLLFILIIISILLPIVQIHRKEWNKIETDFQNPPNDAKPRVWWHWMNGNIYPGRDKV